MFQWSDEQEMVRQAVRDFVDREIRPHREELEFGDLPPYDLLRKLFATFGMDAMQRESFKRRIERERAVEAGEATEERDDAGDGTRDPNSIAFTMIPIIELCRVCPGMVTAMGVSMGLTASAIMSKGTVAQKERWALDLLTMDKVGAWAITEPNSGSDAFGSMMSTARQDGASGTQTASLPSALRTARQGPQAASLPSALWTAPRCCRAHSSCPWVAVRHLHARASRGA